MGFDFRISPTFCFSDSDPKEKPSLPKVVSREELQQVFDSYFNFKHKVLFPLLYRGQNTTYGTIELAYGYSIETKDGKMRIRICNSKGEYYI